MGTPMAVGAGGDVAGCLSACSGDSRCFFHVGTHLKVNTFDELGTGELALQDNHHQQRVDSPVEREEQVEPAHSKPKEQPKES